MSLRSVRHSNQAPTAKAHGRSPSTPSRNTRLTHHRHLWVSTWLQLGRKDTVCLVGLTMRRLRKACCVIVVWCVVWPTVSSPAQTAARPAPIKVVGNFSNVRHVYDDAFGYSLKLWKEGNRVFGLLLVYTGAPSDPPTGILEDVKFDPRSGKLSFSARLTTGLVYGRGFTGVPSRDRFTFKGRLTRSQVIGTLTRADELFPDGRPTTKRVRLRRSEMLTQVMIPPPATYSAWKAWADEMLLRRGPRW